MVVPLENTRVAPPPRKNEEVRSREHLTPDEIDRLLEAAAARGRNGDRDRTMILLAFRHGLRCAELVGLRWDQVDLKGKLLHVRRVKRGTPSTHPLRRDELAAINRLDGDRVGPLFRSELGGAISKDRFAEIVAQAGVAAGLGFTVHAHMLRHACGYYLANAGHDTRRIQAWLGHVNIQHTVHYTELAATKFADFFNEDGEDDRG